LTHDHGHVDLVLDDVDGDARKSTCNCSRDCTRIRLRPSVGWTSRSSRGVGSECWRESTPGELESPALIFLAKRFL